MKNLLTSMKALPDSVVHTALFLVGVVLSVSLFKLFGNSTQSRGIMMIVAVAMEWTKIKDLMKYKKFKVLKDKAKARWAFIQYIIKAGLSVVASVGFALVLLGAQEKVQTITANTNDMQLEILQEDVDFWQSELNGIDDTIAQIEAQLERNGVGYATASEKFTNQIAEARAQKTPVKEKLDEAKNALLDYQLSLEGKEDILVQSSTQANDMFAELASFISSFPFIGEVPASGVKMVLFLLIMVMLEWSIASTAPEYKTTPERAVVRELHTTENKQKEEERKVELELLKSRVADDKTKDKFLKFVENMYMEDNRRLFSYKKVAEKIGMLESDAKKIRETLEKMVYRGKPLVSTERGIARPAYRKEDTLKLVNYLLGNPPKGVDIPYLKAS